VDHHQEELRKQAEEHDRIRSVVGLPAVHEQPMEAIADAPKKNEDEQEPSADLPTTAIEESPSTPSGGRKAGGFPKARSRRK
jgi:hypothetical protein